MAWWRPTKIEEFTKILQEVLDDNILACTDEEIVFLVNEKLEEDEQICQSTFEKWKAGKVEDEEAWREFLRLYKKALISQKNTLFSKMQKDDPQWQKTAWIIERKFDEWNIRIKSENKNDNNNSWEVTIKWQP